jgi:aspartate-semialdehyde dehydrogenase
MARTPTDPIPVYALVGAGSTEGARVRAALAERGVPGSHVRLYGSSRGEALLGEYDGEARLLQDPEPDEVAGADVVFLCDAGESTRRVAEHATCRQRAVDLVGLLPVEFLAHDPLRPPGPGPRRVPHPISIVLAELLARWTGLGLSRASVFVMRPAIDFGDEGLEELREQVLRLLRFDRPPVEVFGRQLAFNVLSQSDLPGGGALEGRIALEVETLLSPSAVRVEVGLAAVPIFHGHAISGRLEGIVGGAAEALGALSGADAIRGPGKDAAATPFDLPEQRVTSVARLENDGARGIRLWAVASEAGSAAAEQALALALPSAGFAN